MSQTITTVGTGRYVVAWRDREGWHRNLFATLAEAKRFFLELPAPEKRGLAANGKDPTARLVIMA